MNIEGTEDPDIPLAQDVLDAMVVEPEWASLTAFLQAHFKVGGERLSDLRAMQCAIVAATRLKSGTFCCSRTRWVGLVRGVVLLLYEVSCFFLIRHHHDSCPYLDTQPNTARPGAVVLRLTCSWLQWSFPPWLWILSQLSVCLLLSCVAAVRPLHHSFCCFAIWLSFQRCWYVHGNVVVPCG